MIFGLVVCDITYRLPSGSTMRRRHQYTNINARDEWDLEQKVRSAAMRDYGSNFVDVQIIRIS